MALWVDDGMPYAASTIAAGNAAIGAWTRLSAWSAQQLADGVVPAAVARTMASLRELAALVAAGLLTEQGDAYVIANYLQLNPSREQVLVERERRRTHAQTAARARWDARGDAPGMPGASGEHGPEQRKLHAPFPSLPSPDAPEVHRESVAAAPPTPEPAKASRRRPETSAPSSSATADEVDAWCARWGIPAASSDPEALALVEHAREKDRRCRDWAAAWRTWQRRAEQYKRARVSRLPGQQPVDENAPWMSDDYRPPTEP